MNNKYSDRPLTRKVWEHSSNSYLLTVTGILELGEYTVETVEEGEDYKTLKFKEV